MEVIFEEKKWRGSWLLERTSCFTFSNQLPLKMLRFIRLLFCGFSSLVPTTRPLLSDTRLFVFIPLVPESRNTGNLLLSLWHHFLLYQDFPCPLRAAALLLI